MALVAVQDGIEQMVSTPHMFNGLSRNPEPSEVIDRVGALNQAVAAACGGRLKILPGNEVHVSHEIVRQVQHDRVTRINLRNYMLVEFPSLTVPVLAEGLFSDLLMEGVTPILVHPERNSQIQTDPSIVAAFVDLGVRIQVTAMSVTGEFGPAAKKCADILLWHNCVHFLASDSHRPSRRAPILSKGRDAAAGLIGKERARALVYDNPRAVVNGEAFQVQPPLPFKSSGKPQRSFLSRFF